MTKERNLDDDEANMSGGGSDPGGNQNMQPQEPEQGETPSTVEEPADVDPDATI